MTDILGEQILAYQAMLPEVRRTHGLVWVLVVRSKLVHTFADFSAAARFSEENFASEQVLIRHTGEAAEAAPFVRVEA